MTIEVFPAFQAKTSKYEQNRGQIGLRSGFAVVPEPDFYVSGANRMVYFCLFSTPSKELLVLDLAISSASASEVENTCSRIQALFKISIQVGDISIPCR